MPERVKVAKDKLLEILEKNLKIHKELYERSLEGYKKQFISLCEKVLKAAEEKNKFDLSSLSKLDRPEDHSDDYSEAIRMIQMHVDSTIILEYGEFRNYVLNKWDWISRFKHSWLSNLAYCSSSISSSSSTSCESVKEYFGDFEEESIE